jgi:hypothetical protein
MNIGYVRNIADDTTQSRLLTVWASKSNKADDKHPILQAIHPAHNKNTGDSCFCVFAAELTDEIEITWR